MQIVADSNVLISAVLWGGTPSTLLELIERGDVQLGSSNEIIDEVREVLRRPKFVKRLAMIRRTPASIVRDLRLLAVIVAPREIPRMAQDPDDDVVLGTALSARAEVVVSGDRHLLSLHEFRGIPILAPAQFLKRYFPGMYKSRW